MGHKFQLFQLKGRAPIIVYDSIRLPSFPSLLYSNDIPFRSLSTNGILIRCCSVLWLSHVYTLFATTGFFSIVRKKKSFKENGHKYDWKIVYIFFLLLFGVIYFKLRFYRGLRFHYRFTNLSESTFANNVMFGGHILRGFGGNLISVIYFFLLNIS